MTARKSTPKKALPRVRASGKDRYHSCKDCPICGTEECRTMQDLGMFCATHVAATEASRGKRRRQEKLAPPPVTAGPSVRADASR
jgi:hypothetical protein